MSSTRSWTKTFLTFASGNVGLQLLGVATGIVVIRALSLTGYAHYSIYISVLFSVMAISESGVGSTLLARGAEVREDRSRLGALFWEGLVFRQRTGLWISPCGAALLAALLLLNDGGALEVIVLVLFLVVTLEAAYRRGAWQSYYRLEYAANTAQNILIGTAALRLVLLLPALLVPEAALYYVVVITAATYWLEANLFRKWAGLPMSIRKSMPPVADFRPAFWKVLPLNAVNAVRGQLFILLLGIAGSASSIAQVSALSRFAVIFALINSVVLEIVSPVLARAGRTPARALRIMLLALGTYAGLAFFALVAAWLGADILLFLIGPDYAGLNAEVVIVLGGAAGINGAIAWGALNQAKLWISGSWLLVPLSLIWCLAAFVLDVASSTGAAWFFALQAVPLLLTELYRSVLGFRHAGHTPLVAVSD